MQYMLLIFEDEQAYSQQPALQDVVAQHMKLAAEMREKGVFVSGAGLQPSQTATTVRTAGAAKTVHDGPYPETREQLGGYYLVDVPDLDAALAWAKRIPVVDGGSIEVRPLIVH
ncbi:YciI family protein [Phenylobacterium aquaticum]|uniref:YciI family protein n=1 Tax=Phenylobacterium aquaticum TaxID=1763816 RepID=UPI001F5CE3D6|nr:YciI family protein [Phenylobacterium aquaticum]MCI3131323.1 YciI family protein [Phenylobacterium aquaticum]